MSYRTNVNNYQIFRNNDYYPEWIEFIVSQGIQVDEDGCYDGNITDFMGMLVTVEKITMKLNKERKRLIEKSDTNKGKLLFDFTNIPDEVEREIAENDVFCTSLFDRLSETIDNNYAFMPYALYLACKDKLEEAGVFSTEGHFLCYKLKEGETIPVCAG